MPDASGLRAAIQALEAQRDLGALDDAAADVALVALREQLRKLEEGATPEPEAERKQITVLFADMSGFTALSERTDAEEMRSLVNQCFDALGEVITRYGGHIDKFIGDELMVLFGAPWPWKTTQRGRFTPPWNSTECSPPSIATMSLSRPIPFHSTQASTVALW